MNRLIQKYRTIPVRGRAALNSVIMLLVIGTLFYHYFEDWTWVQSLYFTVITLTTIGYGDLHPTTDFTRFFTIFFVIWGVSTIAAFLSLLGNRRLSRKEEIIKKRQ